MLKKTCLATIYRLIKTIDWEESTLENTIKINTTPYTLPIKKPQWLSTAVFKVGRRFYDGLTSEYPYAVSLPR